ncbi:post-PEP-CTERM-1 domain-containing protein [Lysobacter cavernae]|uniref:Post-PEP-CTERM-1 domain-containing protein n=1 Tax=Lysobacter cavernae TaxID=1685901 RepID=A0ABV7RPZ8_9GAMM
MKWTSVCVLYSGLALGLCVSAHAAEPTAPPAETTFSGIKVGVDPETGRLRPLTPSESRQLDQVLTQGQQPQLAARVAKSFKAPSNEAAAHATVRRHANGGVSVKLPESQMSSVVAQRDASGQLHIQHADADGTAAAAEGLPHE